MFVIISIRSFARSMNKMTTRFRFILLFVFRKKEKRKRNKIMKMENCWHLRRRKTMSNNWHSNNVASVHRSVCVCAE